MFGFYGWGGTAVVIFQIICIIHAVRTDRTSWIWIILFLPLIGSIIYLASEARGSARMGVSGRKLASQVVDVVQPSRRLDQLRAQLEHSDTVENRLALAAECVRHKRYDEALDLYDSASSGVHKDDPEVLKQRAALLLEMGKHVDAKTTLDRLFKLQPRERTPAMRLLYARIVEAHGDDVETLTAYEQALPGALGDEARCRHAGVLERAGKADAAAAIYERIVKDSSRADGRYRRENREWIEIAKSKLASAKHASR